MMADAAASLTARLAEALAGPGFLREPGFLAAGAVSALVAALRVHEAAGEFQEAGVGVGAARALRPGLRGDRTCWFEAPHVPAEDAVLESLEILRVGLNRGLMLGLETLELHYASYGPGRFYARHLDRSPQGIERVVTVIVYLNAGWVAGDGGELVITTPDGEVIVAPRAGTLVAFLSDQFEHEVRATRCERLSVSGWFSRRAVAGPLC